MKKCIFRVAALALAAVSCGPGTSSRDDRMTVTVTIPPFAWFVEQIGGDDFKDITRGGVTLKDAVNVFTDALEHSFP